MANRSQLDDRSESLDSDFIPTWGGQAERVSGTLVTHGVLTALGVPSMLGRTFVRNDDEIGALRVVVLSHGLWRKAFGSGPNIVGRTMLLGARLGGHPRPRR